ncbi:calcium:cation antiporter [Puniceicoccus vermicola]|uniref:Calcium:proton antiporter n=1 Tax=Puniceicoccus vermicola TaxID=388746 RepID=A0A7X1AW63_9BACT|nr:calcium:proton antiporter [Puniceicoccus vermicola]MBC2600894.1 calcium:proton antiporter [Puniceicoccus vermicola]
MTDHISSEGAKKGIFRSEMALWVGILTTLIFFTVGASWVKELGSGIAAGGIFLWLFAVMLWLSFGVVKHAECLAVKLGEPFGTLILTLAVISIEVVMISAVMMTGKENPTLARDTMFSVVMIVLNGMLGVTLLLGGLRHHEQNYNLRGVRSYTGVLVALGFLCLILPRFTQSAPGGEPSDLMAFYLILVSISLYGVFLFLQSTRHSAFFKNPEEIDSDHESHGHEGLEIRSIGFHVGLLVLTMLPIVLLSKKMALVVDFGISATGAPEPLAGFLVAILVLSPEAMAAIKAALNNQLQRTVNIALGSALATIGLTVPAVLLISEITGKHIELGLEPAGIVLLVATFMVADSTFGSKRTNTLSGAVHLVLFATYVILIFD